jgi:hypothetical protein
MYHIERALKNLRAMVEHHNVNVPTMRYHVDEDIPCSGHQIFQWMGMIVGAFTAYQPSEEEKVSTLHL